MSSLNLDTLSEHSWVCVGQYGSITGCNDGSRPPTLNQSQFSSAQYADHANNPVNHGLVKKEEIQDGYRADHQAPTNVSADTESSDATATGPALATMAGSVPSVPSALTPTNVAAKLTGAASLTLSNVSSLDQTCSGSAMQVDWPTPQGDVVRLIRRGCHGPSSHFSESSIMSWAPVLDENNDFFFVHTGRWIPTDGLLHNYDPTLTLD